MTYFIAKTIAEKPLIYFTSVGDFTDEEFENSPYFGNGLIVKETDIKPYQFGVYPDKIVSGALRARTTLEMTGYQTIYEIENGLKLESSRIKDINTSSFTFDGNDFPMDEVSRLFYLAIEKRTPTNSKIRTMANVAYTLSDTDINDFLDAYYAKLLTVSQHVIL